MKVNWRETGPEMSAERETGKQEEPQKGMIEVGSDAFYRGAGILGRKGGWKTEMAVFWGWGDSKRAEEDDFSWQDK